MKRRYPAIALCALLASCAASDDNKSHAPAMAPAEAVTVADTAPSDPPVAAPAPTKAQASATPSIASVQLKQDCPDPAAAAKPNVGAPQGFAPSMPAPDTKKREKSKRKSDSAGPFRQPCSQSTLQLAFAGQAGGASTVALTAVRLQSADGKALGSLTTRMPSIWNEASGSYEAWDGNLAPGSDHKTSYKLSVPNWSEVEKTLGGSSYGTMYSVEVDVEINGQATTLTSPQFERGRSQIIKT